MIPVLCYDITQKRFLLKTTTTNTLLVNELLFSDKSRQLTHRRDGVRDTTHQHVDMSATLVTLFLMECV